MFGFNFAKILQDFHALRC